MTREMADGSWCDCAYDDRAVVRASPFALCPLCGRPVGPYQRYAETMRRFDERAVDVRLWGDQPTGLTRLARGSRRWRGPRKP